MSLLVAVIGAVAAVIGALVPAFIAYLIISNLTAIKVAVQDLIKSISGGIGTAVSQSIQPLVSAALVFLLGSTVIGFGYFLGVRQLDKTAKAPVYSPSAAGPVFGAGTEAIQPYASIVTTGIGSGAQLAGALAGRPLRVGGFGSGRSSGGSRPQRGGRSSGGSRPQRRQ